MHSSRMHTACSGPYLVVFHTCPPLCQTCPPLCQDNAPLCGTYPPFTMCAPLCHAPFAPGILPWQPCTPPVNHACPPRQPRMPLATTHAPRQPHMPLAARLHAPNHARPPVDRQTPCKNSKLFAGGKYLPKLQNTSTH